MEIPVNQFKEVILCQNIDLDNQLYGKLLDSCPNTIWERFVIWLKSLAGNDHFDKVALCRNLVDFIENGFENGFFDEIDRSQMQTGIENLEELKKKYATPTTSELLQRAIKQLSEFSPPEKAKEDYYASLGMQEVFKTQNSSIFLPNRTIEYLGKENIETVFKEHEDALNSKQISSGELLNIAKIRMEKLIEHNQKILDELPKYFKARQDALKLLFPSHAGQYKELWKGLTSGHLTFDHRQYYLLFQVMKNPHEAQKWLELQANFPMLQSKEKTRILEGLLDQRNHRRFESSL